MQQWVFAAATHTHSELRKQGFPHHMLDNTRKARSEAYRKIWSQYELNNPQPQREDFYGKIEYPQNPPCGLPRT